MNTAAIIARYLPGRRSVLRSLSYALLIASLLAFTAAAATSKWYWGYVFSPRAMPRVINEIEAVEEFGELYLAPSAIAITGFDLRGDLTSRREWIRREPYYAPRFRVKDHLESRQLLGPQTRMLSNGWATKASDLVQTTFANHPDPPNTDRFPHTVIVARSGERRLLVILAVANLWNDHHRHHELVFDVTHDDQLISHRYWQFDSAGLEGLEFWYLALAFHLLLGPAVILPTAVFVVGRQWITRRRITRGRCPACNYDLLANFEQGCSECGAGKLRAAPPAG